MASDAEHRFICLWALSLYFLLGEVSVQILCPFLNQIVCFPGVESCEFYIHFGDHTLSEVSLANMFSHMVGSLFILMLFSLAMKKLSILMRCHLFMLSFMSLALGDIPVKILLHGMSKIFLPMFSWRTFMVSRLIFKSFIHLQFIFVCGVIWWSIFIFLYVAVQLSQHHLLKRLFLLHSMLLPLLSNINWS